MAKARTVFFCRSCGAQSAKYNGRCSSCNEWNTLVEEVITKTPAKNDKPSFAEASEPTLLADITEKSDYRISTNDGELDRVLGGGIVPGSLILIGGEPGIGKSTLMLQVSVQLDGRSILYVSGEESDSQLKMRANRLSSTNDSCYVLTETSTQKIFKHAKKVQPDLIVIDSIQTIHSDFIESTAGSITQIRECTGELQRYAKETNTPIVLIGHITKEGIIAGPKILEHMVDTVLQFEGDRHYAYRILRTTKNRFGSTAELGIYEMNSSGLRQVENPSEILITQRDEQLSGIAIAATIEGARPMMIEVQALVANAVYGTPQRSSTGFDLRRMNMLLAVLEKRAGFKIGMKDVFLNIAGGIKVSDPAIDLAVIAALMSSYEDTTISQKVAFAGEVGLSGEIRAVSRIEQRILEADKLGFEKIYVSKYNQKGLDVKGYGIEVITISKVYQLLKALF